MQNAEDVGKSELLEAREWRVYLLEEDDERGEDHWAFFDLF